MEALYGKIDGGGVVAMAIRGSVVVSAGRKGGVRLWNLAAATAKTKAEANGDDNDDDDGGEPDVASAGEIRGLDSSLTYRGGSGRRATMTPSVRTTCHWRGPPQLR